MKPLTTSMFLTRSLILAIAFAGTSIARAGLEFEKVEEPQSHTTPTESTGSQESTPSQPSHATTGSSLKSYAAVLAGVASQNSGGSGTTFIYSGRIGTTILDHPHGLLSVGLYASRFNNQDTIAGYSVPGSTTLLAAELFSRKIYSTGFYLGGRFGMGFNSASGIITPAANTTLNGTSGAINVKDNATTFAVGPFAGYELPISKHLDFVTDVSWMAVSGGSVVVNGTQTPYKAFSHLNFQAGISCSF